MERFSWGGGAEETRIVGEEEWGTAALVLEGLWNSGSYLVKK